MLRFARMHIFAYVRVACVWLCNGMTVCTSELHTSLDEKVEGVSMLTSFLRELRGHFFPHVTEAAGVLLELTDFILSDEIRAFAISALPDLIDSCVEALQVRRTVCSLPALCSRGGVCVARSVLHCAALVERRVMCTALHCTRRQTLR